MANKITNTLVANITAQDDSTQNISINRSNQNASFDSVLAQMTEYYVIPLIGDNVIPMPAGFCYQLYIKNNDAAAIITPKIQPRGAGGLVTLTQLYPNDQMFIWQSNAGANAGFQAFTLNASVAGAIVEFFIGA